MSNIRIDIASEFKDKGFREAEKRTVALTKSFDKLGKTAKRTFVSILGYQALKRSVNAFVAEDKAATRLAQTLRNLGLAYNVKPIEDFLESTEKATAISKDDLSPALTQLISTTLDAQKSMQLLSVAMDISSATGKDLGSVTTALSRAFNGNYASLGKLQTAYTTAELEAMGFTNAVTALSDAFKGSAAATADSYAGKVEKLRIAFGDAGEELGKGLIQGLEQLSGGNFDVAIGSIVKAGELLGDVFRRAGVTIRYTKELLSTGFRIDEEEARKLAEIRRLFDNPQAAANERGNNPAANRMFLNDMRKQQQLQKKIEADRKKAADLAAKTEKERLKREKEAAALKRAGTVFDMENIQIVAALQNKVTDEQRLRLTALFALQNDNAKAAEALTLAILAANKAAFEAIGVTFEAGDNVEKLISKIIKAQANILLINSGIDTIKEAKNPFANWADYIAAVLAGIASINSALSNLTPPSIPTAPTTPGAGNYNQYPSGIEPGSGVVFNNTGSPLIVPPGTPASAFDDPAMYQPGFENTLANPQLNWTRDGDTYVTNVTVEGSVTSSQDLVDMIINEIYEAQRGGTGIIYDPVAL